MPPRQLTLYTFAMSHYCEKIRWALDLFGLTFREAPLTPVFHMPLAWKLGGRGATTLPILKAVGKHSPADYIQDSTRILVWLDREFGPTDFMPRGPDAQAVSAIEDRFDLIGQDVSRVLYAQAFEHGDKVLRFWSSSATGWQSKCLKAGFPMIRWAWRKKLDLDKASLRKSEHRLQQALAWLDGRVSDGRMYLVGNHLTVADITVAAILAPLSCPPEHPVYGQADFKRWMVPAHTPWLVDRPSLRWVRRLYRQHRTRMTGRTALFA